MGRQSVGQKLNKPMKHLQLYESYQQLPEGVTEISYYAYTTWAEKTKRFSDAEEETLQLLASIAEAKESQMDSENHVVTYAKKGGGKAVSFRKIINDRYALTTVKTTYPTDFRYYASASLDKLLPLAMDYLGWGGEWIEIR